MKEFMNRINTSVAASMLGMNIVYICHNSFHWHLDNRYLRDILLGGIVGFLWGFANHRNIYAD